jgi:integrase
MRQSLHERICQKILMEIPAPEVGRPARRCASLTESQRRKLLDAADHLPVLGGRSRDRRRCKDVEFADERPRRKGYRPWRAIVYTLIETGMRRAAICHLDLSEIDLETRNVIVREKGGHSHRYKISKEGAKAIRDYPNEERGGDQEMFPASPALFLPPETVVNSSGRLSPQVLQRGQLGADVDAVSRWLGDLSVIGKGDVIVAGDDGVADHISADMHAPIAHFPGG